MQANGHNTLVLFAVAPRTRVGQYMLYSTALAGQGCDWSSWTLAAAPSAGGPWTEIDRQVATRGMHSGTRVGMN